MKKNTLATLNKWSKNPRTITEEKKSALFKTLIEFGDISGIVYNVKLQALVGGHMRAEQLAEAEITIVERFDKPNKYGTVAHGYAVIDGEKYSYREVDWDEAKHTAASIAANKGAGEWDVPLLKELLTELETQSYDMTLTGYDQSELDRLLGEIKENTSLDYSVLEGADVSEKIQEMQEGVKKSIVIEFELADYAEAHEIVQMLRTKGVYIGGLLLQTLQDAKKLL